MNKSAMIFATLAMLTLAGCSLQGERIESGVRAAETAQVIPQTIDSNSQAGETLTRVAYGDAPASEVLNFRARELLRGSSVNGLELMDSSMVMTFVSPGCEFSEEEGQDLADAAMRYPETMFVVVHSGGEFDDYAQFVEASDLYGQNILHIDDSGSDLSERFGVVQLPSAVLMSNDFDISISVGALEHDGFDRAIALVS